jgi:hypothetical protein
LSRQYTLRDELGERHWGELVHPLPVGGRDLSGIVLPNIAPVQLCATIAQLDDHAYIQPATNQTEPDSTGVYLNDERLKDSAWLKSGDRIQIGSAVINWTVNGDRIMVEVTTTSQAQHSNTPPPSSRTGPIPNEMPVHDHTNPSHAGRKFRGLGIMLASILLLIVLYLLLSTSVGVQLQPAADRFSLKGFPPPLRLGDAYLALPGDYTLHARRQGYAPLNETIRVRMGETKSFDYAFTELPGQLEISTQPTTNIRLLVDGIDTTFVSDGRAQLSRGEHKIELQTARYISHEQQIQIDGYGRVQKLEVELKPAWASITISSHPPGAEVSIGGEHVGTTPLNTEILQGRPLIEFNLEKYKRASIQPLIQAGVDHDLETVPLQWLDGILDLSSQPIHHKLCCNYSSNR